ncbi:MAG: nucleotidyltransferase domain-containing protein [Candidatus Pacearchaeota archaeon]
MIINLMNKNSAKLILFLAVSPGSRHSRSEIREKTGLNNVPLDLSLSELLALKIIKMEKRFYYLNLENFIVKQIIDEIKKDIGSLPLKVQFEVLDFVSAVLKTKGIENIILFGSYAKLIYSEKSDIDIAVVFADKQEMEKAEDKISEIAEKIGKKHKKEIQEHLFTKDDLKHKEDPLIKDIVRNGKVLV